MNQVHNLSILPLTYNVDECSLLPIVHRTLCIHRHRWSQQLLHIDCSDNEHIDDLFCGFQGIYYLQEIIVLECYWWRLYERVFLSKRNGSMKWMKYLYNRTDRRQQRMSEVVKNPEKCNRSLDNGELPSIIHTVDTYKIGMTTGHFQ